MVSTFSSIWRPEEMMSETQLDESVTIWCAVMYENSSYKHLECTMSVTTRGKECTVIYTDARDPGGKLEETVWSTYYASPTIEIYEGTTYLVPILTGNSWSGGAWGSKVASCEKAKILKERYMRGLTIQLGRTKRDQILSFKNKHQEVRKRIY